MHAPSGDAKDVEYVLLWHDDVGVFDAVTSFAILQMDVDALAAEELDVFQAGGSDRFCGEVRRAGRIEQIADPTECRAISWIFLKCGVSAST